MGQYLGLHLAQHIDLVLYKSNTRHDGKILIAFSKSMPKNLLETLTFPEKTVYSI